MEPNLTKLLGQAAAYQAKGQVNQAEKVLKQALGQAQQAGDKRSEAMVKNNLASLWILASKKYRSAGEEADVYLLESLKVAEELKDKKLEASIRVNLGNLLVGWGNYEDAGLELQRGGETRRRGGRQRARCPVSNRHGHGCRLSWLNGIGQRVCCQG